MKLDRPVVSRLNDADMRHYRFERSSGLPRGYFDHSRVDPDVVVFWVIVLLGGVALGVMFTV